MHIRLHDDLSAFAQLTRPLLDADPVRHTLAVSVLAAWRRGGTLNEPAVLLTVHGEAGSGAPDATFDVGELRGAVLRVDQWPLIVSALPAPLAPAVAQALHGHDQPPGVHGPQDSAEAFATQWARLTGVETKLGMAQRLFALGELRPPRGVPGAARVAGQQDLDLLIQWRQDFADEALHGWPAPRDPRQALSRQIAAGQANVLWELDGQPVSLATAGAPAAGMSRIGPVWTPREYRGRGFGSAVTAACSQQAMDAGARHVVLFTDLTNPVSNSIYRKMGYRPVQDVVELVFGS